MTTQQIKKQLVVFIFIFSSALLFAQQKNFFLTGQYTRGFVDLNLIKDNSWIKYPSYSDRAGWSQLPEEMRKKTIQEGEKYIGYVWPQITATMYLEFTRKGNRDAVDNVITKRRNVFCSLVYPGPLTTLPGFAPVCSPSFNT